jgi:hypothetical protein
MIQDVSEQLFQMFSQRMRAELEQPAPVVSATAPEAPQPPPAPLDVGSLGARAAGHAASRAMLRPGFWIVVLALCILVYLLSR